MIGGTSVSGDVTVAADVAGWSQRSTVSTCSSTTPAAAWPTMCRDRRGGVGPRHCAQPEVGLPLFEGGLARDDRARRGVIVNIASVNGLAFFANEPYSAAKAGVISLTRSMATRYGRHGIRAVAIAPGTIRTPIWQERVDKEPAIFERLVRWYPLRRVGEPEDVAAAAAFLASDDASWITGEVLRVDGGLLAGNERMARELVADFSDDG